ncbi:hypothetical protein DFS33DRAFT_1105512 [Desarmillaria ectypa]|nr:hypothetical protein DFS33DRAFT_1105512 [Desarmillaria ectypa]
MYNHSHVLLAACSRDRKAQANTYKSGVFTTAVLEVLESARARGKNISSISYVSLIEGLHQPYVPAISVIDPTNLTCLSRIGRLLQSRSGTVRTQFPHCEGSSYNRGIFSPRVVFIDHALVRVTRNGNRIFLSAGNAQGVIPGSEYFVHRDRDIPTASSVLPGAVLQVSNIDTFRADTSRHAAFPFSRILLCKIHESPS